MKKLLTIVCFLFIATAKASAEPPQSSIQIADLLFPRASTWPQITSYPHPDENWLKAKHDEINKLLPCYAEHDNSAFFKITSVNDTRIIFIGEGQCGEGMDSVIWPISNTELLKPETHWGDEILRIMPDPPYAFVAISAGCCADPIDTYILEEKEFHESISILKELKLPESMTTANGKYTAPGFLSLRSSPQRQDNYDNSLKDYIGEAVFGNITLAYQPETKVSVLKRAVDNKKTEWLLIKVGPDQATKLYNHYDPFGFYLSYSHMEKGKLIHSETKEVVGWVEASCLTKKCSSAPINTYTLTKMQPHKKGPASSVNNPVN